MPVVDADGHVEESVAMFGLLDKEYYPRRPLPLTFDTDTVYGGWNAVWFIDGDTYPKVVGRGGSRFVTPTTMELAKQKPVSIAAQELTDVPARLRDLDRMGIDYQVIYPTLFLTTTAEDVELETALLRTYNTFMAEACANSGGRLRFAALVPIRDVQASVRELRRANELGAAALMLLGIAWDKTLGHKALYPLYEEAAHLNIPVCIHFGWGSPGVSAAFDSADFSSTFSSATLPVLAGFHSLMLSGVLEKFTRLTVAFLETGAGWVPHLIHQLKRGHGARVDPARYFREGRLYVACEADEDINYVVSCIGEDALVVASDYPHSDFSKEENMRGAILERADVPLRVREKILGANPVRLYKLPE